MPAPTHTRSRRLVAALLALATALSGLAVGSAAAPAGAAPTEIQGGYVQWGFKQSFRHYVRDLIPSAPGTITLGSSIAGVAPVARAGAVTEPPLAASSSTVDSLHVYRFGALPTGTDDPATKQADVETGGVVRFRKHGDELDVTIDHVRVHLDGDEGTVVADVTSRPSKSLPTDPLPALALHDDVVLADLDLSAVAPATSPAGTVTYAAVPALLTEDGAEAFAGFYDPTPEEPVELDPVTIVLQEPVPAPPAEGTPVTGSVRWTMTGNVWSGPGSLNGCPAVEGGASILGLPGFPAQVPGATAATDPDSGFSFPILDGTYDEGTGETTLQLQGAAVIGNKVQGNYRIKVADPTLTIDADDVFTLRADVSYSLAPSGDEPNPAGCSLEGRTFTAPVPDVILASGTGGLDAEGPAVTGALQPYFAEHADQLSPPFQAALDPSLRGHFYVSDGNNATSGSLRKVPTPIRVVAELDPPVAPTVSDFDGDGVDDLAVYRPSNGTWYSPALTSPVAFGNAGDVPVAGAWDPDPETDIAVYRPSNHRWYVDGAGFTQFGAAGDVPVPADYTGDGLTDIAMFRPSTGRWYVVGVEGSTVWGRSGDIPVPGDYDGDGSAEVAVYRPSNRTWYAIGQDAVAWGAAGDKPVPMDHDGDGTIDVGVYRPSNGYWYLKDSIVGIAVQFGGAGDRPVPGRYGEHDTQSVPAVFRPGSGRWYRVGIDGFVTYGVATDVLVGVPPALRAL